jgi:hypothetical protein
MNRWIGELNHQLLEGVLAQAKSGGKHFWKQKFHAANERLSMDSWGVQFFSFWKVKGEEFFRFFPLFSSASLCVPKGSYNTPPQRSQ